METVHWGVVGAGRICERMSGPPLYLVNDSSLELVHRRSREEGEEFVIRHGHGRYLDSFDALINDESVDAVYIATPHLLHEDQAIAALKAGKHVLVETPMGGNSASCLRMTEAAAQWGKLLGTAFYRRGYPSVQKLKAVLQTGLIGPPIAASINAEMPTSHRIDLIRYILGDISEVRRDQGSPIDGFPSPAPLLNMTTSTGVSINMQEQWLETGMPESMMVEGEDGIIYLQDIKGGELLVLARGGEEKLQLSVPGLPFTHWALIENFVSVLTEGGELLCPGTEGVKTARVLEAMESAETGGPMISITDRKSGLKI